MIEGTHYFAWVDDSLAAFHPCGASGDDLVVVRYVSDGEPAQCPDCKRFFNLRQVTELVEAGGT